MGRAAHLFEDKSFDLFHVGFVNSLSVCPTTDAVVLCPEI